MVQPEWHPGDHDDHEGRDVDGDDVVRDLTLERHIHREATVLSCKMKEGEVFFSFLWNYEAIISVIESRTTVGGRIGRFRKRFGRLTEMERGNGQVVGIPFTWKVNVNDENGKNSGKNG